MRDGTISSSVPSRGSGDGLGEELTPNRLGLPVIHDEGVEDKTSGYAEADCLLFKFSTVHYGRKTERSPGDRDRLASHDIVDDLVRAEISDVVGTVVIAYRDADHQIGVAVLMFRFFGSVEVWTEYRGNSVLRENLGDFILFAVNDY